MEQLVRIKEIYDDGAALVIRVRESACSGGCHKCSGRMRCIPFEYRTGDLL